MNNQTDNIAEHIKLADVVESLHRRIEAYKSTVEALNLELSSLSEENLNLKAIIRLQNDLIAGGRK